MIVLIFLTATIKVWWSSYNTFTPRKFASMETIFYSEMIPSLTKHCIVFLHDDLDSSNIFCVLKHYKLIENKSLWHSCWKFRDRKAKDVLEVFRNGTIRLDESLKGNTLNIKEIELFIAINKCAENECKKLELNTTKECRQILGDDIRQLEISSDGRKQIE